MTGYSGSKDDYLKRLKRIEGQVRGLHRMVEDDTYCIDILTQVAAAKESPEAAEIKIREAIARLVRS